MKADFNVDVIFLKVLQILTQDTTPSSDLISTVKHLYETKFRVCSTPKSNAKFSCNALILFVFLLFWFSFAGCYNSCSIIVIALQNGGYIENIPSFYSFRFTLLLNFSLK